MSDMERQELEACLFGYPPYERYGAPEPEVFMELYPLLTRKMIEGVSTQLFQLESTTRNQRELLWERFKSKTKDVFLLLTESWKNVPQNDPARYDAIDVDRVKLGELKTTFDFPVDIVEFLERKSPSIQPAQLGAYSEFLEELFRDSLNGEYFVESPINPLVGLLRLIQTLPGPERERVYRYILSSLVSERTGSDDERVFFEIAPLLPSSLVTLAESIAKGLHRDWAVEVLHKARGMPAGGMTPYQSNIYKWLGSRARLLLKGMPKKERDKVLQSAIERLWERHSDIEYSSTRFSVPLPTKEFAVGLSGMDVGEKVFREEEAPAPTPPPPPPKILSENIHFKMKGPPVRAKPPLRVEPPSIEKMTLKPGKARKIVVNPGFAETESPEKSIDGHMPLKSGRDYYFWIQIGKKIRESIEKGKTHILPPDLSEEALLKIALFPFKGELELGANQVGWMRLKLIDGQMTGVVEKHGSETMQGVGGQRLLFRVKTPSQPGDHRLRCNIYYKQVLLQSRVVTARVEEVPLLKRSAALQSIVDYSIGLTLNAAYLGSLQKQDISLMLNDNGGGTHSLRVFTDAEKNLSVDLDEEGLRGMIAGARETYREVSWGNKLPFKAGNTERYGVSPSFDVLKKDLILLARQGYKLYTSILGMVDLPEEFLEEVAKKHKHVEFVIKDEKKTSSYIVPIALIYDHPLDDEGKLDICPTFRDAYRRRQPLEETPCFNGACPSYGDLNVVCPSGFWGYRNSIGLPTARNSEIDYTQKYEAEPTVCACANTSFTMWRGHLTELKKLTPNKPLREAYSKETALKSMKEKNNVVYFYCHGDRENRTIYIRLGPEDAPRISPSNLRAYRIKWDDPKPLVFINGCNTAALEAEQALNFVQPLLKYCNAAGVIGTDITVFESLATQFAEGCLGRFLRDGEPIGEAVRKTRIELLQRGNPLGLVYVPYVHDGLRLVKK
jgi:hypothetical protein